MLQNVVMKDAIMMLTWQMLTAETLLKIQEEICHIAGNHT
jgi:hypothetical protein